MNTPSEPGRRQPCDAACSPRKRSTTHCIVAVLCMAALYGFGPRAVAQDQLNPNTVSVSGGMTVRLANGTGRTIPGVFTWSGSGNFMSTVPISGFGWRSGMSLDVYLRGPLNTLGVARFDRGPLATFVTDANGRFQGSIQVPYANNPLGPFPFLQFPYNPDITRPGLYAIFVRRSGVLFPFPDEQATSNTFNICPNTLEPDNHLVEFKWDVMRGGRDGFLGDHSPERVDPEYMTIWSQQPVGLYATVAPSTLDGTKTNGLTQGSHIAYQDFPWTHFAHDWNLHLIPDFEYQWVIGSANHSLPADEHNASRIEWEWEVQNAGSPFVGSYGQGIVGVPLFALATPGDRIYTVGRWIMDNGHPDEGDRSEIHPARMIATMRKRHTIVPFVSPGACITRAAQVDVFVSGHGGGANQTVYTELERLLDNNGRGGGRVEDVGLRSGPVGSVYYRYGPNPVVHSNIGALLNLAEFLGIVPETFRTAGPSGMFTGLDGTGLPALNGTPWLRGQPELLPVNDMDYEFDVPLPPRPAGATTPLVQITTQPMHSTSVREVITYFPSTSPTIAHIRLPYRGADNGIYARTFKFYWDAYSAPGNHFVVQLTDIETSRAPIFSSTGTLSNLVGPQPLYLWADVCGEWRFLTDLNRADLLSVKSGLTQTVDHATFAQNPGARFDVYLDDTDSLRVFVGGYAQRDMDSLFGRQFSLNAYDAGIEVAEAAVFGSGDNQDLGGAVFNAPMATSFDTVQGPHIVNGQSGSVNSIHGGRCPDPVVRMFFTATYVPPATSLLAAAPLQFGAVCSPGGILRSVPTRPIEIHNTDPGQLVAVTSLTITGGGFSLVSPPALPFFIPPGGLQTLNVTFSPTFVGPVAATLTVGTADACRPPLIVPLFASGQTATISPLADVARTPTLAFGSVTTWGVTIRNTTSTTCTLHVLPSITGSGGTWQTVLPPSYFFNGRLITDITIPPGGVNTDLIVKFTSGLISRTRAVGTLTLSSNDLRNPSATLTFGAEVVPVGMRVLVLGADGKPYRSVDNIKLKSSKGKVNTHIKDAPLTTIDPPESWRRIQYHYMTPLNPAEDGTEYELQVQVKNMKKTVSFSLGPKEFRELTVTLP